MRSLKRSSWINAARMSLIALCATFTAATVAEASVQDADWIVTVQTEELKGMMNFKKSEHKDPVKVHVTWKDMSKPDDKPVSYEDFWFNEKGKLIGQEKHIKYAIRPAEQIIITIKHKKEPPADKEFYPAADAALRFYLDSTLRQGKITAIRVPMDSFGSVEQAFQKLD